MLADILTQESGDSSLHSMRPLMVSLQPAPEQARTHVVEVYESRSAVFSRSQYLLILHF